MTKKITPVSKRAPRPFAAEAVADSGLPPIPFPIVGIGGSAGGLEAFTELLQHLPADSGMAFIIVQHLDPNHESGLTPILARATQMKVREAVDGTRVKPNEVYVIPPNRTMILAKGRLDLKPRGPAQVPHLSIDIFFQSLAQERREGAIGVVFSGNAADGTNGLEAIKAGGGITFAQDKSARYDSMPRNAIASGCIDFIMSPEAVARELARIARHPYVRGDLPALPADSVVESVAAGRTARARRPGAARGIAKILELAQANSGVDFALYKISTIHRRITRRMVLNRKDSFDDYARLVAADPLELKALFVDLLICVTSFFRDEAAFEALKKTVIVPLLTQRPKDSIRVWTIGCSGGQEAYSIAMAFFEAAEGWEGRLPKLQIFGTDLNEQLLNKARHALYPKSIAYEISPERLRKFFVEEDSGYRVIKSLREMCVFGRQDLLGDPPFSRMDLVTCRNVMIYIEANAQKRVMPMLHYALKPGGFLFLGTSESVVGFTDLFDPLDSKQKTFQRKSTPTPAFSIRPRERQGSKRPIAAAPGAPLRGEEVRSELNAQREADRLLANQFGPPGVLIDASFNVLQFRGSTDAYLTPPSGKASFQLLKLARELLIVPLRAAINQARKQDKTVRREKVRVGAGKSATVNLLIIPLKNLRERHFLVLFEDPAGAKGVSAPPPLPAQPPGRAAEHMLRKRNAELELELREIRDYLQSAQQQQDTANDELQASNEEVQSSNEELQSINEELETSKEELESGNEELVTVNEEMAFRNSELSQLNSDLNNFHVSVNTAIVVVGRDLAIRQFTPLAAKIFNLIPADIGRPLAGINHTLQLDDLEGFVSKVITLLAVREVEARSKNGHWYLLRARPYLTVDNKIDGAILVLLDIDALKRSKQAVTQERDYAEATLRTARDSLIILRPDLTVNTANEAFYRTFSLTPAETENKCLFDLSDGAWNIPALRSLLADVLPRDHVFNDLEVTHDFGALGERTMMLNGRRLESVDREPLRIVLAIQDVTDRLKSSSAIRASELRYRRLFEAAKDGVIVIDPETRRITDVNPFMVELLGFKREEYVGKELFEIGLFEDEDAAQAAFLQLRANQEIRYENLPLKGKDGATHEVEVVANLYDENGHAVIQCNVRDITQRKRFERALRRSEARFEAIVAQATAGIAELDLKGRFTLVNERFCTIVGRTSEELYGLRASDITHPDDLFAIAARFMELAKGHEDISLEKRYLRPDGSAVWVNNSVAWITDHDDVPHGFVEISQDISDRKKLETALQASEAYFRDLTESLPIAVWTSQPDGRVDYINRHWLSYTGQTFRENVLYPQVWLEAVHAEDRSRVEQISAARREDGQGYSVEARFRDASSGNYRWFLKRSVPVYDDAGALQKRIGICIDIDDMKRAQVILADHTVALEVEVQARTVELRETIGELEAFSYSVSHDMRAPLRAMQGFALLLQRNHGASLDPVGQDQLRRITSSAERMDALINDVLTYSRLLRSEIVLEPINLNDLVRMIIASYPNMDADGAEIVVEGTLPTVLANEASLTQVISNLLSNAVKFVAPGTKARVRVHADEIEGDARVWFVDNGIGIDPVNHRRIWNIFTQIGRAKDYQGTGIGLAIVRKAVERMNGKMGLESELGQGSKFWIRLARAKTL